MQNFRTYQRKHASTNINTSVIICFASRDICSGSWQTTTQNFHKWNFNSGHSTQHITHVHSSTRQAKMNHATQHKPNGCHEANKGTKRHRQNRAQKKMHRRNKSINQRTHTPVELATVWGSWPLGTRNDSMSHAAHAHVIGNTCIDKIQARQCLKQMALSKKRNKHSPATLHRNKHVKANF